MKSYVVLPTEIIDKIFLLCNQKTLKQTRILQSRYVKNCTEFFTFNEAAFSGNLANLRWLRKNGYSWNIWTFSHALNSKNLAILNWLYKQGCPWSDYVFTRAIKLGNLEIIMWLHSVRCPWSE